MKKRSLKMMETVKCGQIQLTNNTKLFSRVSVVLRNRSKNILRLLSIILLNDQVQMIFCRILRSNIFNL